MSLAKITMIGLQAYLKKNNDDLFSELSVPTGIDKETLENSILDSGSEFEVMYPNPDIFKMMVGIWSKKYAVTMAKWLDALTMDYAMIENYDRKEEWTDTTNEKSADSKVFKSTTSNQVASNTDTKENVSAFDSAGYQPRTNTLSSDTTTNTGGADSTDTSNGSVDTSNLRSGRAHGNIGVTTNQQMLESEMNLRNRWKLYDLITDLFLKNFCIMVY